MAPATPAGTIHITPVPGLVIMTNGGTGDGMMEDLSVVFQVSSSTPSLKRNPQFLDNNLALLHSIVR